MVTFMKMNILTSLIYYFMRLLDLTYRYEYIDENGQTGVLKRRPSQLVYALWHQNVIAAVLAHFKLKEYFTMIVSESEDGEFAAQTCIKFGHSPVRGSSSKGGKRAMLEMIKNIQAGFSGAITVDGPRGPRFKVKFGIIEIARHAEIAIVPLCPYPSNYWFFKKSWDQFRIPKPFTKITVVFGDPIYIPKDSETTIEEFSKIVAQKISSLEEIALKYNKR